MLVRASFVVAAAMAGLTVLASGCSGSAAAGGTAVRPPTGIQFPARIGSLQMINDEGSKGSLYTSLPGSVRKNLHMVLYADGGGSSRTVVVSGGMGFPVPSGGPA